MKRTFRLSIALVVLSSMLSGCIIWPWWDEGGHGGHHHGGGYGHGHGDHR